VEASAAGQGQGDAGQGEAAQQQGPDMSALAEQIGNLTAGQEEQVARPVFALAKEMAEHNGHPELSQEPWFVRMVYTAGKALEAAQEEGAESPSAAHLEGGGGAAPAGSQVDAMTQVFGAGEDQPLGRRALPFAG
jgi:hypothetical protein